MNIEPTLAPPAGMIELGQTATTLLRAVGRAYPHGAPREVEALTDRLSKLAGRAAMLAGALETLSKALERFAATSAELRAQIERKIEEERGDSTESRAKVEALRGDLARYDAAVEEDGRAAHVRIEAHAREARTCAEAFAEIRSALVERLRDKPACRELLEGI